MALNLGAPGAYKLLSYPVSASSYFNNSRWAYHVHVLRDFMEVGKPVDMRIWSKPASLVNAWYSNYNNALYIPAGMLTKPFFSPDYPIEQNFGAIGTIMAHEMSHGFDERGAQIDENGHKRKWWSNAVVAEFEGRVDCVKDLYGSFEIAGRSVSGSQTVSENIADWGGLKVAYLGYLAWYRDTHGGGGGDPPDPPIHAQRLFFVSYAQNWCNKQRPKVTRYRLDRDVHAPEPFRANGAVAHNPAFADVFSCPRGSPMNPVHKCGIWKPESAGSSLLTTSTGTTAEDDDNSYNMVQDAKDLSAADEDGLEWGWSEDLGPAQYQLDVDDGDDGWLRQRL